MSDLAIYKLIKLLVFAMGRLPQGVLKYMSDSLAMIWFLIDKRHRKVVMDNIRCAYPERYPDDRSARRFAKRNFKHTVSIAFDVIWSYSKTPEELYTYFDIRGWENLEAAMAKGRGMIGLTCHMGVFELLVVPASMKGAHPYVLYRTLDFAPLERLTREMRGRFGAELIPLRKASDRMARMLKNGDIVATLLDQNVDWYKGAFVDFYGRPACTNNGLAKLAMKTRAPVVPAFIMKEKNAENKTRYVLSLFPEVPLQDTGDRIKDIENNTQNYVKAIEFMVRHAPEQYFWVHNRWKTKSYCLLKDRPDNWRTYR